MRRRSPFMMGLLVLSMTGMILVGTTSARATGTDLSTQAGIESYLVSIGVNPLDAVWQTGMKNYAGPSCPGAGWNCTRTNNPVVQFAPAGGTNVYSCGGSDCVAVQSVQAAAGPVNNNASCKRSDKGQASVTQTCDIAQENTTKNNDANVEMNIEQNNGSTQTARQSARVVQTNDSGDNHSHITEKVTQKSSISGGGTQDQEAHQGATVDQTSASGDNASAITQQQNQQETASGGGSITQLQNTTPGADDLCDLPSDALTHQQKNECAILNQNFPIAGAGRNDSTLTQKITEKATASKTGDLVQTQGTPTGGQSGDKGQHSSGISTSHATQAMTQQETYTEVSNVISRSSDTGDPRCCQDQDSNPNDQAFITQNTNQSSSPPNAEQNAFLLGHCDSTGNCNVKQTAVTDDDSLTQTCTGNFCDVVIFCFGGEGEGFCEPGGEG
jgi:hypothetical protein